MEYRYTGIILNKRDVGETDRIYTIYTLEGGKIRSLAKGVRKPQAKLAASLENITLADITIIRTRGLGKITGSIIENNFTSLKRDCDALLETFAGLNIFEKLVDFESSDKKVFLLLKEYLEVVNECSLSENIEKHIIIRLGFIVKLLDALGYTIEVDNCVSCGKKLAQDFLCFSSQQGGAICQHCANGNDSCVLSVRTNTIKMLRLFLKNKIQSLTKIKATREDCDSVCLVVDDFLRWTL
ncbi:MAG: repair protein RecO protein [Parcubacteria group bacterium GW2011_GWD2_38_11]|nr:MAG: repair protein RecO protein [Parcubacteria group bacterium GW2011_GWD2_38_11]